MRKILPVFVVLYSSIFPVSGQSNIGTPSLIRAYLLAPEGRFNLTAEDLNGLHITDNYRSHDAPWNYVYVRQQLNGLPVLNSNAILVLQDDQVLYAKSALITGLHHYEALAEPALSASEAFDRLAQFAGLSNGLEMNLPKMARSVIRNQALSEEPITIETAYLLREGRMRLVWHINWFLPDGSHWYDACVDAEEGKMLEIHDWILHCHFSPNPESALSCDHEIPDDPHIPQFHTTQATHATSSYQVFPVPVESPNHGNRQVVSDPADSLASPFGWHDTNGAMGHEYTTTRGNNVRARDDKDNNNTGGLEVDGGSQLEFIADFDINQPASLYLNAAIINLFYWNNIMHDVWYHYGFDEAAGNFQFNNYGRGGQGEDFVYADAQDGSGMNNANFSAPPDGLNPRMQMFLWQAGSGNDDYFQVNGPGAIAGKYLSAQSGFGPRLNQTPLSGKLVLANDGSSRPAEACQALINASEISGNIALINRGDCQFVEKIGFAQSAGAIAVVMINNVPGDPIIMGGSSAGISIPAVMISQNDGNTIVNAMLTQSVHVSLYDSSSGGMTILDSDFDNGVIAHEYTHGISIRLTGGPSQVCLTGQEQMGEGWSDFLSLVMTHAPGAQAVDRRGIGTYVVNEATSGGGIRPYPYSTSRSINPVTYDDIKSPQFTVPHGVGMVWCSMLWDLYWAFIDKYGYDANLYTGSGGNNMVMHLVMDGLKLQGCEPGFVDGRDAILAADKLRFAGANQQLIWEVFAARGLGYSASQGSPSSKTDGTEAFDLPPALKGFDFQKSGPELARGGDTIRFALKVWNLGKDPLRSIKVLDTLPAWMDLIDTEPGCPLSSSGKILEFSFPDLPAGDSMICGYRVRIQSGIGGTVMWSDDVEAGEGNFRKVVDNGGGNWLRMGQNPRNGGYSWFINNPASASDRSLQIDLDLSTLSNSYLCFYHSFATENGWDGAVVEIQNGATWTDLGDYMTENGYNNRIQNNPASAISNRPAFSGNSQGYVRTVVDLSTFSGQKRTLRFRFVSDGLEGGTGWYLDDFELWEDYTSLQNKAGLAVAGANEMASWTRTVIQFGEADTTKPVDTTIVVVDSLEKVMLYPNPVRNGYLNARYYGSSGKSAGLDLYDLNGRLIWNGTIQAGMEQRLHLPNLAAGIYYVRITTNGVERIEKIHLIR